MLKNIIPESNSQTTLELRHFLDCGQVLFDTNDPYPIWKEEHRPVLEKKIIDHYAMQQIGFETFGRFKHELNTRMREIMPYYVELYKTTLFEYNPIENYNMTEGSEDNTKSAGSSEGTTLEKFSDTPQSEISNLDKYLSSATQNEGTNKSTGTSDTKHTAWRKGNIGVMSTQNLIQQERDIILNIDKLIIDELKNLFLGVL